MSTYRWIKLTLVVLTMLGLSAAAHEANGYQGKLTPVANTVVSPAVSVTDHMTWPMNTSCGSEKSA